MLTDLPESAPATVSDLVPVEHPSIRALGAYFHEGWPHSGARSVGTPGRPTRALHDGARLLPDGFGLAIWDAWRDPRLQAVLHDRCTAIGDPRAGFRGLPGSRPATMLRRMRRVARSI